MGPHRLVFDGDRGIARYYVGLAYLGAVLGMAYVFLFVGCLVWGR
jgi:hypothetical protein